MSSVFVRHVAVNVCLIRYSEINLSNYLLFM